VIAFGKQDKPLGFGTGFFFGADGYAMTNFHVVSGAAFVVGRSNTGVEFCRAELLHEILCENAATSIPSTEEKDRELPLHGSGFQGQGPKKLERIQIGKSSLEEARRATTRSNRNIAPLLLMAAIEAAPSTTCWFVTTWPSGEMKSPVPSRLGEPFWSVVTISTTAGLSFATISGIVVARVGPCPNSEQSGRDDWRVFHTLLLGLGYRVVG